MSLALILPTFVMFIVNSTVSPTETFVSFTVLTTVRFSGTTSMVSLSFIGVLFSSQFAVTLLVKLPIPLVSTSTHMLTGLPEAMKDMFHSTPLRSVLLVITAPLVSISPQAEYINVSGGMSVTITLVALPRSVLLTVIV